MDWYQQGPDTIPFSLPQSNAAIGVLAGDIVGIATLVSIGLMRHNTPGLLQSPSYAGSRILPFVIAWVLVAVGLGLFAPSVLRDYRQTLVRVVPGWTAAAILGALIRDAFTSGGADPVFVAVMVGFGLLVLVPWRLGVVAVIRRQVG
jgi:hypothetical protein